MKIKKMFQGEIPENKILNTDSNSKTDTFSCYYLKNNFSGGGGVSGDTLPIGSMMPYGNSIPPTNWLVCDGRAVSREEYAELFSVIGINYGAGDGSTTFNLPNKQGRVSIGLNTSDTDFNTIGKTGGEKEHTLTIDEMPSHTHQIATNDDTSNEWWGVQVENIPKSFNNFYSSSSGGNLPHNILQPYEVDQWIIKAFQSGGSEETKTAYSTEEQIIGTWTDGKPLYRMVFIATTTEDMEASATTIATLPLNTRVRKFDICLTNETSGASTSGNTWISDTNFVFSQITATRTQLQLKVMLSPYSTYGNRTINAILEYTKSDD